jgi:excisionase family DNA binding protein
MKKKEKLLTTVLAAKILGLSPDYVRRLCLDGIIQAQKLGHDWLMYESAIKGITRQRKKKDKLT